jgi:hypothetical protein
MPCKSARTDCCGSETGIAWRHFSGGWLLQTLHSLVQVCTDIILANTFCGKHPPHRVEKAEEALRFCSITILSFFVLEWVTEVRVCLLFNLVFFPRCARCAAFV